MTMTTLIMAFNEARSRTPLPATARSVSLALPGGTLWP